MNKDIDMKDDAEEFSEEIQKAIDELAEQEIQEAKEKLNKVKDELADLDSD